MKTREIPHAEWPQVLNALSNLCHKAPLAVTVEQLSSELGDQVVAKHVPLRAITYEEKGSEARDIAIELGDDVSGNRLLQRIHDVSGVYLAQKDDGSPHSMDIEGEDHVSQARIKTVIRFES
ncbi:MAG: DUF5335 family protein [Cyanobacteria bacterium NC_groundwater_1444_Ag_S-0.65um_54_12]|nr:DUF5335 family protein [Cyanobacteria bacterium NC_groundwater_1444_Ag_S-0.65um_54_12]